MTFEIGDTLREKHGYHRENRVVALVESGFMWVKNERGHTDCIPRHRWDEWELQPPRRRPARKKLGRRLEL